MVIPEHLNLYSIIFITNLQRHQNTMMRSLGYLECLKLSFLEVKLQNFAKIALHCATRQKRVKVKMKRITNNERLLARWQLVFEIRSTGSVVIFRFAHIQYMKLIKLVQE